MPHPTAKLPHTSREAESGPEREPELDYFVRRLQLLGAEQDEIDAVVEHWDDLDEDWTAEQRSTLVGANDSVVLAELARIRDEYPYQPETAPEPQGDGDDSGVVMGVESAEGATGPQEATAEDEGANGAGSGDEAADGPTAPAWTPPADASVPAMLAEVGEDPERARIALAAEEAHPEPRKTLVKALRKLVGG